MSGIRDRQSIYLKDAQEALDHSDVKNILSPNRNGVRETTFRRLERASSAQRNFKKKFPNVSNEQNPFKERNN